MSDGYSAIEDFSRFSPSFTVSDGYMDWYEILTGINPLLRNLRLWMLVKTIGPEGNVPQLVKDEIGGTVKDSIPPNPVYNYPTFEFFLSELASGIFLARLFGIPFRKIHDEDGIFARVAPDLINGNPSDWADNIDDYLDDATFGYGKSYDPPISWKWEYEEQISAILVRWSKSLVHETFGCFLQSMGLTEEMFKNKHYEGDQVEEDDEWPTGIGGSDPPENEDESDSDSEAPPPMIEAVKLSKSGQEDEDEPEGSDTDTKPLDVSPQFRRVVVRISQLAAL